MRKAPLREEKDLVRRAQRGDERAMRQIYDAHAARVNGVALSVLGDEELAQDASQETWIRAFRSLHAFRGDSSFSTWIYRIAVNCSIRLRQRNARRTQRREPLSAVVAPVAAPSSPLLRVRLHRAVMRLPAGMRAILLLHDVEGYTHQEIARRLRISAGTSKSQLSRARQRLRGELHGQLRVGDVVCAA